MLLYKPYGNILFYLIKEFVSYQILSLIHIYKPGGCFLANLFDADTDAVKIALTGTPLLKEERASCKV